MFPQSLHQQYFNVFMVVPADLLLLHNLFILSLLQLFFFHYSSHSSLMAPVILLSWLQSFFSHYSSNSSLIAPVILLSLLQLFFSHCSSCSCLHHLSILVSHTFATSSFLCYSNLFSQHFIFSIASSSQDSEALIKF